MSSFEELCRYLDCSKSEDDTESFESESLIIIDWKEDLDVICELILPEDGRFSFSSGDDSQTIVKDGVPHKIGFSEDSYCQWEVLKALNDVLQPEYILLQYAPYRGSDCWGLMYVTKQEYDTLCERYGKELYNYFIPGVYDNVGDYENKQSELMYGRPLTPADTRTKKSLRDRIAGFFGKK